MLDEGHGSINMIVTRGWQNDGMYKFDTSLGKQHNSKCKLLMKRKPHGKVENSEKASKNSWI